MESQSQLAQATRLVNAKIGFYVHLAVFVLVNALLIAINLTTSPGHFWFQWPLCGWGIGLALHGVALISMVQGRAIKAEMIRKMIKQSQ